MVAIYTEIKGLLSDIQKESAGLRTVFMTVEELKERKDVMDAFDKKMQQAVFDTLKNMESYRKYGWRDLVQGEENGDGAVGQD